jgi:hypothetical protein
MRKVGLEMTAFDESSQDGVRPIPTVTGERLNEIVLSGVRKLFETDIDNFMEGYLKYISSKEKVAE